MSSQNSDRSNDKPTKDPLVLRAFQTACLAIIVYLATLIGDLLYKVASVPFFPLKLFIELLFIFALDFLEIINNWASIKKYFGTYYYRLFLADVLTLGTFFWQIYLLSKLLTEDKIKIDELQQKALLVAALSYGCIFSLYALWNHFLCKKDEEKMEEDKKREYIYPMYVRRVLALISFVSILVGVDRVPLLLFIAFVLFSGGFTIHKNWRLFSAIMEP